MTVTFNFHILSDIPLWLMLNLFRSGRREQTYLITEADYGPEDEEGVPYKKSCIRYDSDIQSHFCNVSELMHVLAEDVILSWESFFHKFKIPYYIQLIFIHKLYIPSVL